MISDFTFANWARGYFWEKVNAWRPERHYATEGHGKANQWGDGAWIFYTFDRRCLTKAVDYDGMAITVPREETNVRAMEDEFFTTMKDRAVYGGGPSASKR